jgi:hypothetical protein
MHAVATHKEKKTRHKNCQFCGKRLRSKIGYFRHANANHGMEVASEWLECNICHVYFPGIADLTKHMKQEHDKPLSRMILDSSNGVPDGDLGDEEEFDMDTLDENASLEPSITINEEVSDEEIHA